MLLMRGSFPISLLAFAGLVSFRAMASDTDGGLASVVIHEDFLSGTNGTLYVQNAAGVGATGSLQADAEQGRPGILEMTTGTTATGRGAIATGASKGVLFGGGEWTYEADIDIVGLANYAQDWVLRVGFIDSPTIVPPTDGAWLEYQQAISPNWIISCASSGTITSTVTGTAVAVGWHRPKIVVNSGGTAATFTMDGAALGTITTNIPTAPGCTTGVGAALIKTAGVIPRSVRLDWIEVRATLTTAR